MSTTSKIEEYLVLGCNVFDEKADVYTDNHGKDFREIGEMKNCQCSDS